PCYPLLRAVLCSLSCKLPQTTQIAPLSLHDALPIYIVLADIHLTDKALVVEPQLESPQREPVSFPAVITQEQAVHREIGRVCYLDRKSTRLNSSHVKISYAVFCLKKKRK